jgi:tryptophanyl-tRNA synthetase
MEKKILVSGIKPTGAIHLGNYFGAIKQFVDLQKDYSSHVFLADYHALTSVSDGHVLSKNTFDIICAYLACGLDPKKTVLYRQSALPEHAELAWIFDSLVTMPWLMRAHAFKAIVAKNHVAKLDFNNQSNNIEGYEEHTNRIYGGINIGTFNYKIF